jgi:hypothetical protein
MAMSLATYNVTIEPSSPATPVDDPEIAEVIDLVTGEIIDTAAFIGSRRYDEIIAQRVQVREALKQEHPTYACALCWTPVYLVASMHKRFFFRHTHEDGSCRAQTRNALTEAQIRARKYGGLCESEAHKRIKRLIEQSLRADPAFVTESILTEKRWSASDDPNVWRQPDVQAKSAAGRFAFEAQLSTTFLDVVVARRLFYQEEGATLVWVLGSFDPEYRRMTTDDLLFSNNSNVFVIDDETAQVSEERKQFHLRCHYRQPFLEGETIRERWENALVSFHELTTDRERQRIYLFDYEREEKRLKEALDQMLRDDFISFWLRAMSPHFEGTPDNMASWMLLRERFDVRGVPLPDHPSFDSGFRSLVHGVLSAMHGKPVGWQFNKLVEVAHFLAQGHPESLLVFGFALKLSGHDALLKSQDTSGKWRRKREELRPRLERRDPEYMPNPNWLRTLLFLFPEVGAAVRSFIERETTVSS